MLNSLRHAACRGNDRRGDNRQTTRAPQYSVGVRDREVHRGSYTGNVMHQVAPVLNEGIQQDSSQGHTGLLVEFEWYLRVRRDRVRRQGQVRHIADRERVRQARRQRRGNQAERLAVGAQQRIGNCDALIDAVIRKCLCSHLVHSFRELHAHACWFTSSGRPDDRRWLLVRKNLEGRCDKIAVIIFHPVCLCLYRDRATDKKWLLIQQRRRGRCSSIYGITDLGKT